MTWASCGAPPTRAVGLALALGDPRPLRSAAITAASSLLRAAPSLDGASLLSASPFELAPFLAIAVEGSGRPNVESPKQAGAASMPDTILDRKQVPSRGIAGQHHSPLSMSSDRFRHPPLPHLTPRGAFSVTLATRAFDPRRSR